MWPLFREQCFFEERVHDHIDVIYTYCEPHENYMLLHKELVHVNAVYILELLIEIPDFSTKRWVQKSSISKFLPIRSRRDRRFVICVGESRNSRMRLLAFQMNMKKSCFYSPKCFIAVELLYMTISANLNLIAQHSNAQREKLWKRFVGSV